MMEVINTTADVRRIAPPFLHTIEQEAPGWTRPHGAGDLALIIPGLPEWDDSVLLINGQFAACSVFWRKGYVHLTVYGGEAVEITREQAAQVVVGRVARIMHCAAEGWAA